MARGRHEEQFWPFAYVIAAIGSAMGVKGAKPIDYWPFRDDGGKPDIVKRMTVREFALMRGIKKKARGT